MTPTQVSLLVHPALDPSSVERPSGSAGNSSELSAVRIVVGTKQTPCDTAVLMRGGGRSCKNTNCLGGLMCRRSPPPPSQKKEWASFSLEHPFSQNFSFSHTKFKMGDVLIWRAHKTSSIVPLIDTFVHRSSVPDVVGLAFALYNSVWKQIERSVLAHARLNHERAGFCCLTKFHTRSVWLRFLNRHLMTPAAGWFLWCKNLYFVRFSVYFLKHFWFLHCTNLAHKNISRIDPAQKKTPESVNETLAHSILTCSRQQNFLPRACWGTNSWLHCGAAPWNQKRWAQQTWLNLSLITDTRCNTTEWKSFWRNHAV